MQRLNLLDLMEDGCDSGEIYLKVSSIAEMKHEVSLKEKELTDFLVDQKIDLTKETSIDLLNGTLLVIDQGNVSLEVKNG